ncbi:SWI/SNF related-matrix-associated actin-dependent regulator of chromatin subfamily C [Nematocida ausubeli]|nr:SWI/SNF related-matrix-associated actin-dependent regulator of chromatin subfamily C [Nematocida ausubeli]KAI5163058.1 SWI/SNF related-matrix-associated actin-dependent regulator of chromatin subfamily C [Nematocida ausubeli]
MNEWSYKVDKVAANSKTKVSADIDKKVVNISCQPDQQEIPNKTLETEYPELFKRLEYSDQQAEPVLVPLHSAWFSTEEVHPIERRFFSSLLTGQEEVQKYISTRNTIFKLYQKNTSVYLSITQCRKCISEDISTLIRIYSFLEHWGLINYKIGVKRDINRMLEKMKEKDLFDIKKGSAAQASQTEHTTESSKDLPESENPSDARKTSDSPRYSVVGESTIPQISGTASLQKGPTDMLRDPSKHFSLQTSGVTPAQIPVEMMCTSCSKNMHILSEEEKIYFSETDRLVLCTDCFNQGKYAVNQTYSNFHILEAGLIRQVWSEKEEMLLVEGIEMYKDDWKAVSDYVKTKTLEQCVLHFLKMGIQDPFLEMEAISFAENRMPFNYTLNPVMATVAFLASAVHPGVASVAAKAAAGEIQRLSKLNKDENHSWLNDRLNEIAAVSLSSSIGRATEQKALEEGKKERLLELLVESEMKRIDLKVNEFTDLTRTLRKEREDLEKMRETYRKAHIEIRKEISEIVTKVKKICEETGRNFEEIFFNESSI